MSDDIGVKAAIAGVAEFFDGEWHRIKGLAPALHARGQRQDDECPHPFEHCLVDQGGGGFTGDDFHGTVYFYLGDDTYLAVEY